MKPIKEIKENFRSLVGAVNHDVIDQSTIKKVMNGEIDEVICEKIPVLSNIYSIVSGSAAISDNLFYRKIITVVYQTKEYSESEYNNLIKEFRKKGEDGHEHTI